MRKIPVDELFYGNWIVDPGITKTTVGNPKDHSAGIDPSSEFWMYPAGPSDPLG